MKKVLVLLAMLTVAPLPVLAGPTPIIVDAPTPAAQISETVIYTDLNGVQVAGIVLGVTPDGKVDIWIFYDYNEGPWQTLVAFVDYDPAGSRGTWRRRQ